MLTELLRVDNKIEVALKVITKNHKILTSLLLKL
jgi:hypothetical protein